MVKKTKDDQTKAKLTFKSREAEVASKAESEGSSSTDSSLAYERAKMLEFNSELDIYSEIDSLYFKQTPKRRGTLASKQMSAYMKPIVAEESENERGSEGGSGRERDSNDKDGDEEDGEEEVLDMHEIEDAKRESAMDERDAMKKELQN